MDLRYTSNSGEKRLRSGTDPGRIHYRICRNGISLYQAPHDVPVNVTGYALEHALVEPLPGTERLLARSLARSTAVDAFQEKRKRERDKCSSVGWRFLNSRKASNETVLQLQMLTKVHKLRPPNS
jgi:hypothetical protein